MLNDRIITLAIVPSPPSLSLPMCIISETITNNNNFLTTHSDSNSKKSCQGCELPSDDVPDSTSNSRGQNNNTPSATNNNSNNNQSNINERTNGAISRTTPNSTMEMGTPQNTQSLMNSTSISNADSSIASTGSLDEEEESSPVKIKKKEEIHGGGGGGRKVIKKDDFQ